MENQMENTHQATIHELEECRELWIRIIRGAREIGDTDSKELITSIFALKVIEEQLLWRLGR